jgi:hypothetical protein
VDSEFQGPDAVYENTSSNQVEFYANRRVLFQNNRIHSSDDCGTCQSGMAIKEGGWGHEFYIIRWNNFNDNEQSGVSLSSSGAWGEYFYIYGNLFDYNGNAGLNISNNYRYINTWSNIAAHNFNRGINVWRQTADASTDLKFYNWTIVFNGNNIFTTTGLALVNSGSNVYIKNSILAFNKDGQAADYQAYSQADKSFEHNGYYKDAETALMYYDNTSYTIANFKSSEGEESAVPAGEALSATPFIDEDNDDFTLDGSSVNDAADLSGTVGSITFTGSAIIDYAGTITMYWDDAIDPDNYDFSSVPTDITMVDQDLYGAGWERGAYVFAEE